MTLHHLCCLHISFLISATCLYVSFSVRARALFILSHFCLSSIWLTPIRCSEYFCWMNTEMFVDWMQIRMLLTLCCFGCQIWKSGYKKLSTFPSFHILPDPHTQDGPACVQAFIYIVFLLSGCRKHRCKMIGWGPFEPQHQLCLSYSHFFSSQDRSPL